jgi:hypothetical protein
MLSFGRETHVHREDIEIIPLQKVVTVLPEDTFGINKILSDYRVETTFQTLGHRSTKVEKGAAGNPAGRVRGSLVHVRGIGLLGRRPSR